MKKDVPLDSANRLINNGPVVLVSSRWNEKNNVFTVAWNMPVSHEPPLVAISCGTANYSYDMIKNSGEFVLNIPSKDIVKETFYCGTKSGEDTDKFKESGLTLEDSRKVDTPIIKECIGHLECELVDQPRAGDHQLFVGEVQAAYAEKEKFDKTWLVNEAHAIHHLGSNNFCESQNHIRV